MGALLRVVLSEQVVCSTRKVGTVGRKTVSSKVRARPELVALDSALLKSAANNADGKDSHKVTCELGRSV